MERDKAAREGARMKNYRQTNSCGNCEHLTVMAFYQHNERYCSKGAPPRPHCGSMPMGEDFMSDENLSFAEQCDEYERQSKVWESWRTGRGVAENGTCDDWKGAKDGNQS